MSDSTAPFALPPQMAAELSRMLEYWDGLKRATNPMPFWDDVSFSALPALADRLMLIEVFKDPQRFRLNIVGNRIAECYGSDLSSQFVDKLEPKTPFEYFVPQAGVTVESRAPTFYRHHRGAAAGSDYARLMLPLWGEGEVRKLLGGISFGHG